MIRYQPIVSKENVTDCQSPSIDSLPNEILQKILRELPSRELFRCRKVCTRWKEATDYVLKYEKIWRDMCIRDHRNVYDDARWKCYPSLTWRDLYVSLTLWSKLKSAKITLVKSELFNIYPYDLETAKGMVVVHGADCLLYYGLDEMISIRNEIEVPDSDITELYESNDVVIYITASYDRPHISYRKLNIVPKVQGVLNFDSKIELENINKFILCDDKLYYDVLLISLERSESDFYSEMYVCDLKNDFKCTQLQKPKRVVDVFGCTENGLHYVTPTDKIYTLKGQEFVLTDTLDCKTTFHKVCKYNLTGRLTSHNLTEMSRYYNHLPFKFDYVRVYGNMTFTICNKDGMFRIYDVPLIKFNKNTEPVRKFPVKGLLGFDSCEIIQMDVMEKENGHVVIILTREMFVAVSFTHDLDLLGFRTKKCNKKRSKNCKSEEEP